MMKLGGLAFTGNRHPLQALEALPNPPPKQVSLGKKAIPPGMYPTTW